MKMEIKVDEDGIQEAMNKCAVGAVESLANNFEIRNVIKESLITDTFSAGISAAVNASIKEADFDSIAAEAAVEITRVLRFGITRLVRESVATMLVRASGIQEYDREKWDRKQAEILESMGE